MINEAWIEGNVCWMKLTQDKWTQIDTEDISKVQNIRWYARIDNNNSRRPFYAYGNLKVGKKWLKEKLHRRVVNLTDPNLLVDHLNGDTLDNRKQNLKVGTDQQNSRTRRDVKGYYWLKNRECWKAVIEVNNKKKLLGYFKTEDEARNRYLLTRDIMGWDN